MLEGPKRARVLPKVLSIAEVDTLLKHARANSENTRQPLPQRLRAARLLSLLEVVYATGLRVSELVALPSSAAQRDQRMLIVRGKGSKERLVRSTSRLNAPCPSTSNCVPQVSAMRSRNGCSRRLASRAT